ncbi:MAG TPA: MmgE/PrpD family protein [Chloroflexota bacterium]|nr:MmgE/PrpD family protein [Chloroflexota bacterium]
MLTQSMAAFALGLRLGDVPAAEVRRATRLVADGLACALGARGEPLARRLAVYARRQSAPAAARATLLVGGRATPALAALANGTALRLLDANDLYLPPPGGRDGGHFSDALSALLGAAEVARASGAALLSAVIAAYELQALVADAADWRGRGWHPVTPLIWALPAPLARLHGRSLAEAVAATSMAGTTGQALQSWLRPDVPVTALKSVAPGLVGQRAVEAVELAAEGVTAPPDALEVMLRQLGCAPEAVPVDRLGRTWTLDRHIVKRYPAQYLLQGAVEATLALHAQGVRAEHVEAVTVYGHAGVCGGVHAAPHAYAPASHEDADHSTPFVVALALLRGRLTPADYADAPWQAPDVRALMGRVRLIETPERQRAYVERRLIGCEVVVRLRDGSERRAAVAQPHGHPDAPLGDADLVAKLDDLLAGALGPAGGQRLLAACAALPAAPTLDPLLALVSEAAGAPPPPPNPAGFEVLRE